MERETIIKALHESGGNVGKAAKLLGSSRRTLQNRMREHGLAKGKSGRPKRRLPYGKKKIAWGVGATVVAVGAAVLIGRTSSKA